MDKDTGAIWEDYVKLVEILILSLLGFDVDLWPKQS